jgi:hypothetical protein
MAEALSDAVQDTIATKTHVDQAVERAVADLRIEIREVQVTVIKWLVPLLLGQAALIAALVRLL